MMSNSIVCGDALTELQMLHDDSIDLIATDPPYGYSFMNKDWDKAVVGVETWKECHRVLKAGAFAFIMSSPRQDVLAKMVVNLIDAGFETNFTSIYWTYASGFPKAADVSKLVDKRNGKAYNPEFREYLNSKRLQKGLTFKDINEHLGYSVKGGNFASDLLGDKLNHRFLLPSLKVYAKLKLFLDLDDRFDELIEREEAEREIIGISQNKSGCYNKMGENTFGTFAKNLPITKPETEQAKALEGAYCGFQPKPAVEVVLVVMKPLSEKSYVDQALQNGKGITWLDKVRIPYQDNKDIFFGHHNTEDHEALGLGSLFQMGGINRSFNQEQKGRFPANLLVSDDVLNDGKITKSNGGSGLASRKTTHQSWKNVTKGFTQPQNCFDGLGGYGDSGSYSRYFDLDKWFDTTFPFLITPKASKSEKNMGLITSYIEDDKKRPSGVLYGNPGENRRPYLHPQTVTDGRKTPIDNPFQRGETLRINTHPTVKPIKLMSYLIMLGSRPNDIVLDPFCGSGTTCIVAKMLKRQYIGIELNQEYVNIANARLAALQEDEQPTLFEMITTQ